ncbi:hypothetical protein QBC46DRAFT_391199 [Diplogelasinospora grovesii]|uniref:BTB domain-containing protein n=1 Tax=Diplogelasinospora grovesii TaxID=303347 RepID=A0AAN6N618_9PEZI|nr:hypothetical protein QBC46DRAFT_391199 [Diplogelasinospora grovesii]
MIIDLVAFLAVGAATSFVLKSTMAKKKKSTKPKAVASPEDALSPTSEVEEIDTRPETSPYASPAFTLPFAKPFTIPTEVLRTSPKLLSICEEEGREAELQQVPEEVGHIVVHYLHTGTYETLKPKESATTTKQACELKTSIQAYVAARNFELPALRLLAERKIEQFGDGLPTLSLLEVTRDAYPALSESDEWFLTYLKGRIRPVLEDPIKLLGSDFLDRVSSILSPNKVLLKTMMELFCEKMIPRPEPAAPAPVQEAGPSLPPPSFPPSKPQTGFQKGIVEPFVRQGSPAKAEPKKQDLKSVLEAHPPKGLPQPRLRGSPEPQSRAASPSQSRAASPSQLKALPELLAKMMPQPQPQSPKVVPESKRKTSPGPQPKAIPEAPPKIVLEPPPTVVAEPQRQEEEITLVHEDHEHAPGPSTEPTKTVPSPQEPEVTSESEPKVVPEAVSEVAPEEVPEVAPEVSPTEQARESTREEATTGKESEATPEIQSETKPEAKPEAKPETKPEEEVTPLEEPKSKLEPEPESMPDPQPESDNAAPPLQAPQELNLEAEPAPEPESTSLPAPVAVCEPDVGTKLEAEEATPVPAEPKPESKPDEGVHVPPLEEALLVNGTSPSPEESGSEPREPQELLKEEITTSFEAPPPIETPPTPEDAAWAARKPTPVLEITVPYKEEAALPSKGAEPEPEPAAAESQPERQSERQLERCPERSESEPAKLGPEPTVQHGSPPAPQSETAATARTDAELKKLDPMPEQDGSDAAPSLKEIKPESAPVVSGGAQLKWRSWRRRLLLFGK